MSKQGSGILAIVGIATALASLSGCYTQLGSFRDPREPGYSTGSGGDGQVADSVNDEEYTEARQRFYDEAYYPSASTGWEFGWGSPWYGYGYARRGYGNLWYDSPWYYDPFFGPYGVIVPWYAYHGHYYNGGGYFVGATRSPGTTRRIGTNRTMGTSRGTIDAGRSTPGYVPLPVGVRADKAGSTGGTPPATGRQGNVSTGRRGAEGERRAPAGTPPADKPKTSHDGAQPRHDTPRPAPAPDSGRRSSGADRSSDRPAYTPPPSPPPQSQPAPSQPAPSGGNRGGENRGSGSEGSRGGNRR